MPGFFDLCRVSWSHRDTQNELFSTICVTKSFPTADAVEKAGVRNARAYIARYCYRIQNKKMHAAQPSGNDALSFRAPLIGARVFRAPRKHSPELYLAVI